MSETTVFRFKSAVLRSAREYRIYADQIERISKDDVVESLSFHDVCNVRYADTTAREYHFRRLDLEDRNGKKMRIHITTMLRASPENEPDLRAFYELLQSIGEHLHKTQPSQEIILGETTKISWIIFSLGLAAVFGAIGILAFALLAGVSEHRLMEGLVPMLVMAGFGIYICVMSRPWRPRPTISLLQFLDFIKDQTAK